MSVNRTIALTLAMLALGGTACEAQGLSPYSAFQGLTQSELGTVQVKITTVGTHFKGMYTVASCATGHTADLGVFRPFYRPQFQHFYSLDLGNPPSFTASTAELAALIDSVGTLAGVTDGDVDLNGAISFALSVVKSGTTKVFEAVLDTTNCKLLYGRILGALSTNVAGTELIGRQACSFGLLPGTSKTDVTSQVSIRTRGFRRNRGSGQFVGKVRVTNISGQSIASPIILTFRPDENISLASRDGYTCAVFPAGAPFQILSTVGALGPGQHVDVFLRFDNPDADQIQLNFQHVYAGPGFQ